MNGHGWVVPNPSGIKARCGGPGICPVCQREEAALKSKRREATMSDDELRNNLHTIWTTRSVITPEFIRENARRAFHALAAQAKEIELLRKANQELGTGDWEIMESEATVRARSAAIEQCAKVAETFPPPIYTPDRERIAAAIRALASKV